MMQCGRVLLLFLGLTGKLEEGKGKVAVAIGILVEVILMILLGCIEML